LNRASARNALNAQLINMNTVIKAIKIDPNDQSVTLIDVRNDFLGSNGMYEHMRTNMIEHYPIEIKENDILLVDEEALFKEPEPIEWTFDIYLVKGPALIVGGVRGEHYSDVKMSLETAKKSIHFNMP
jgi:hypothetical protein